jgi:hypothetical protein
MKRLDRVLCVAAALFGIGGFISALRLAGNPMGPQPALAFRSASPACSWPYHGLAHHLARMLALGSGQPLHFSNDLNIAASTVECFDVAPMVSVELPS